MTRQLDAPLGEVPARRAAKTDEQRDAIRWERTQRLAPYFDRGCEIYIRDQGIKAAELAERMTVDPTQLSRMRSGERIIESFAEEVLRAHRPSRLILASADADHPALTFAMLRDRIVEIVIEDADRGGLLGKLILDEVARREGVDRGDIDAVIERTDEEPAGPPADH